MISVVHAQIAAELTTYEMCPRRYFLLSASPIGKRTYANAPDDVQAILSRSTHRSIHKVQRRFKIQVLLKRSPNEKSCSPPDSYSVFVSFCLSLPELKSTFQMGSSTKCAMMQWSGLLAISVGASDRPDTLQLSWHACA